MSKEEIRQIIEEKIYTFKELGDGLNLSHLIVSLAARYTEEEISKMSTEPFPSDYMKEKPWLPMKLQSRNRHNQSYETMREDIRMIRYKFPHLQRTNRLRHVADLVFGYAYAVEKRNAQGTVLYRYVTEEKYLKLDRYIKSGLKRKLQTRTPHYTQESIAKFVKRLQLRYQFYNSHIKTIMRHLTCYKKL